MMTTVACFGHPHPLQFYGCDGMKKKGGIAPQPHANNMGDVVLALFYRKKIAAFFHFL